MRWWFGVPKADASLAISVNGYDIGLKAPGFWKNFTQGPRIDYCVWRWLLPKHQCLKVDQLKALQVVSNLVYLSHEDFLDHLIRGCRDFEIKHPELKLWIRRRIALAEMGKHKTPEIPESLISAKWNFMFGLMYVTSLYQKDIGLAKQKAQGLFADLLDAAATAALSTMSSDCHRWRCESNFMIPVCFNGNHPPAAYVDNFEKAKRIWGELPGERVLMVLAENSDDPMHLGFWVPLRTGNDSEFIPGAPDAYEHMLGTAVFKDDLPPIAGFSIGIQNFWKGYMSNDFGHKMFISLPVIACHEAQKRAPVGVFNINLIPPADTEVCYLAYHHQWLRLAQDRAAPFLQMAWFVILLASGAENGKIGNITIDTGVSNWNNLQSGLLLSESET
jgi:hypothetical protein